MDETRGTLGTEQCIARCHSCLPSEPHAHLHCVGRSSIVGSTPDIGGRVPGVDAQFTACLRVRLFIQMGATRARLAAAAACGLPHSARWKVIRTCACSICTRAHNACTLRRFRRQADGAGTGPAASPARRAAPPARDGRGRGASARHGRPGTGGWSSERGASRSSAAVALAGSIGGPGGGGTGACWAAIGQNSGANQQSHGGGGGADDGGGVRGAGGILEALARWLGCAHPAKVWGLFAHGGV